MDDAGAAAIYAAMLAAFAALALLLAGIGLWADGVA